MDELREHLQRKPSETFGTDGLNEIVLSLYTALRVAVRDDCDRLVVAPLSVAWSRGEQPVNHLNLYRVKPTMNFHEALERILERDEVVRSHLQPISRTLDETLFRITYNTSRRPAAASAGA